MLKNQKGFSLAELLVALGLSMFAMTLIYSAYRSQTQANVTQTQVVEMQQNIRAALFYMTRSIRMAGFDPDGIAEAGFVAALPSPHAGSGATTSATAIAFTVDDNENGAIDDSDAELFAYRLNGTDLEQYVPSMGTWLTLAEHIDALNFVYLDASGTAGAAVADVRSIQITIVARSGDAVPVHMMKQTDARTYRNQQGTTLLAAMNDNYRRRCLSAEVKCRNMGLF